MDESSRKESIKWKDDIFTYPGHVGKRDRQQFASGVKKNDDEVAFPPDEIYGTFIDIDSDLTMNKEDDKSLCSCTNTGLTC